VNIRKETANSAKRVYRERSASTAAMAPMIFGKSLLTTLRWMFHKSGAGAGVSRRYRIAGMAKTAATSIAAAATTQHDVRFVCVVLAIVPIETELCLMKERDFRTVLLVTLIGRLKTVFSM